ncbi:MAG: SH3 domain-containing protein [Thermomicrobiales bacterium]
MAVPTHTARRFSWRALAGAIVLAGTVSFGVLTPVITTAQTATGGYIGYDTPSFSAGQSVAVQTDDGGGLSLRFDASVDAERIGALQDGAVVRVVAGPYYDDYGNGWYLVTDGSLRAFAYAGFLVASGESAAVTVDEGAASSSSGYLGYPTPDFSSGQTVAVQTDDGGGLSLRLEPSTSGEKLAAAKDGSTLTVIEGPYTDSSGNGWYLVTNGPLRAYAFAGFLVATSSSSSSDSSSGTSGSGATVNLGNETPQFSAGQSVTVQTDDGGGLSLRLEPSTSAEKLAAAKDGAALTIIEGPVYDDANNGWYLVTNGPLRAWAYAGYLVAGGSTASAGETSSGASSSSGNLGYETPQFAEGQGVIVQTDDGGGLSLRMEATVAADKLAAMKDGANLTIVQGPVYDDSGNGWYLVTNGSIRAYAFAGFLQRVALPPGVPGTEQLQRRKPGIRHAAIQRGTDGRGPDRHRRRPQCAWSRTPARATDGAERGHDADHRHGS